MATPYTKFADVQTAVNGLGDENAKMLAWSNVIIELLKTPPAGLSDAKTAYVTCLEGVSQTLFGADKPSGSEVTIELAKALAGGSRSSRQTRRRRNGGKRNQRR